MVTATKPKSTGRLTDVEGTAASLLGVPRHTLRDLRLSGRIRASRLGKRVVYTRDSLLVLLRENRCE